MFDRVDSRPLYYAEGFQMAPGYKSSDRSPNAICGQTFELMNLIFNGILRPNSPVALEYFGGDTVSYFESASKGFFARTDHRKSLDKHLLIELLRRNQDKTNDDLGMEDREAFGHSIVVLAYMPVAPLEATKVLASHTDLSPPVTTSDYLIRLDRMKEVMQNLSGGKIGFDKIGGDLDMVRTVAFFETAKMIPLHVFTGLSEAEDQQRNSINQLLTGIEIDI